MVNDKPQTVSQLQLVSYARLQNTEKKMYLIFAFRIQRKKTKLKYKNSFGEILLLFVEHVKTLLINR